MNPIFLFDLDQTLLNFHASEEKALEIKAKISESDSSVISKITTSPFGWNWKKESYREQICSSSGLLILLRSVKVSPWDLIRLQ